jgi:hypothetical protein
MDVTDDEIEAQVRAAEAAIHAALYQKEAVSGAPWGSSETCGSSVMGKPFVLSPGDDHRVETTDSDIQSDEFEEQSDGDQLSGSGSGSDEYSETEEYQSHCGQHSPCFSLWPCKHQ